MAYLPEFLTSSVESLTGGSVWDLFGEAPAMRARAELIFETRQTGLMRYFWDGVVSDIAGEMSGRFLRIRYRIVRRVDVETLDGLLESIRGVATDLGRPFGSATA